MSKTARPSGQGNKAVNMLEWQEDFLKLCSPARASLAFTTGRQPTYMDHGAALQNFAKTVVNLSSGLLLAELPSPRSRNIGCVELLLSLEDLAAI
ncbi:hypothetical protein RB195_010351 [Necator americanus]|uniref:Uncharacterized protein n=1 Tax=Necator americanus TaxID=51031 RepID=A0ABR1CZD8_NECAM